MPETWARNLDVQVRLAGGQLTLKLGSQICTLSPEQSAMWRSVGQYRPMGRPEGDSSPQVSVVERKFLEDLVGRGMLIPAEGSPA